MQVCLLHSEFKHDVKQEISSVKKNAVDGAMSRKDAGQITDSAKDQAKDASKKEADKMTDEAPNKAFE